MEREYPQRRKIFFWRRGGRSRAEDVAFFCRVVNKRRCWKELYICSYIFQQKKKSFREINYMSEPLTGLLRIMILLNENIICLKRNTM